MTKNVTNRPGQAPMIRTNPRMQAEGAPSTKKPTTSDKLKDKKQASKSEKKPSVQRQQRPQRAHAAGAHGAVGAHGDDHDAGEAGGAGNVSASESADEMH